MTFNEYVQEVAHYMRINTEQRMGQAFMNVLWFIDQDQYRLMAQTADPFFDDTRLVKFLSEMRSYFD